MIRCPVCGGRTIGKVGAGQYYCWDCCVEFGLGKKGIQVYRLEEDGTLVQAGEPVTFQSQQARVEKG